MHNIPYRLHNIGFTRKVLVACNAYCSEHADHNIKEVDLYHLKGYEFDVIQTTDPCTYLHQVNTINKRYFRNGDIMDVFIGTIMLFPYNFAPQGWSFCNGQILPINQYTALFSLLGNKFGGDGTTNFVLPNLQGAEPLPGTQYYIAITGIYPSRA